MAEIYRSVKVVVLNASDCNQSTRLLYGAEAFMRFDSVRGPVHLHWRLPWIGRFSIEREADRRRWKAGFDVLDSEPAAIAVLATVTAIGAGA